MKLVIQISDDAADATTTGTTTDTTTEETVAAQGGSGTPDGLPELEARNGGPVPEILLSMESEVAAGLRSAPHLS